MFSLFTFLLAELSPETATLDTALVTAALGVVTSGVALLPIFARPVSGSTITGRVIGPVGSRFAITPDSNFSIRAINADISVLEFCRVSFTKETSSSSRASGAWRISISTSPRTSIARTTLLAPILLA